MRCSKMSSRGITDDSMNRLPRNQKMAKLASLARPVEGEAEKDETGKADKGQQGLARSKQSGGELKVIGQVEPGRQGQ